MIPLSDISNYENLKKSIDESLLRGNMYKNSIKLSEDFYFTKFDPLKNYTLTVNIYSKTSIKLMKVNCKNLILSLLIFKIDNIL